MTDSEYRARQRQLNEELDFLESTMAEDQLEKRFLKNFGCINFQNEEFFHELGLARVYHARHMKKYPGMHEVRTHEPYRCYHVTECKCGFAEAYDSGD